MFLRKILAFTLATLMTVGQANAAERVVYIVSDAAGSPVAEMDEQGAVIWRKSYKPYGEEINPPAGNPNPSYTGKPLDAETGLIYMGARSYDPEIGRFTGIDPRGFNENNPQSFGRYVYANNSPYVYNDPNGEEALTIILGVTAGLLFVSSNANAPESQNTPTPALSADGLGVGLAAGVGAYAMAEGGVAAVSRLKNTKGSAPKELTKEQQKSVRSYEKRISEHEQKLEEFRNNPTVRPGMENLPAEVIKKQQQARISHLESEIRTFKDNIQKILRDGE